MPAITVKGCVNGKRFGLTKMLRSDFQGYERRQLVLVGVIATILADITLQEAERDENVEKTNNEC